MYQNYFKGRFHFVGRIGIFTVAMHKAKKFWLGIAIGESDCFEYFGRHGKSVLQRAPALEPVWQTCSYRWPANLVKSTSGNVSGLDTP